jgi:regulator of protease activity HflC (stomatin/prohibitin superfamily)
VPGIFDKLFEVIAECFFFFVPFVVIRHFERAVQLRYGVDFRANEPGGGILTPGFHWVRPFNIDEILKDNVKPRVYKLEAQSLTTADGVAVLVGARITAEIFNVRRALLEVEDMDHALADSCPGIVAAYVASRTWAELQCADHGLHLLDEIRCAAEQYGVRVVRVQLADLQRSRSLHIHGVQLQPPAH